MAVRLCCPAAIPAAIRGGVTKPAAAAAEETPPILAAETAAAATAADRLTVPSEAVDVRPRTWRRSASAKNVLSRS